MRLGLKPDGPVEEQLIRELAMLRSKAEVYLRRAYNRTFDRLERMQKARLKMPLDVAMKQTQLHATYEAIRTTCPKCNADNPDAWKSKVPPRHPAIDEKCKLIKYPKDHPMYRPKNDDE